MSTAHPPCEQPQRARAGEEDPEKCESTELMTSVGKLRIAWRKPTDSPYPGQSNAIVRTGPTSSLRERKMLCIGESQSSLELCGPLPWTKSTTGSPFLPMTCALTMPCAVLILSILRKFEESSCAIFFFVPETSNDADLACLCGKESGDCWSEHLLSWNSGCFGALVCRQDRRGLDRDSVR